MSGQEVKMKSTVERMKVYEYLTGLAGGFKLGTVHVQKGGGIVTLKPEDFVKLKVEAYRGKHKEKLCFEMSWHRDGQEHDTVKISAAGK
ncbi:MAG: amphi-Trp domain-containing protein [Spirochaetia bacterium]|nr:amphi-Trp domain-containing protein [Spirochaetia bacterium]